MAQPSLDSEHTPVSSMPARKSFAQVAAAANKPIVKKDTVQTAQHEASKSQELTHDPESTHTPEVNHLADAVPDGPPAESTPVSTENTPNGVGDVNSAMASVGLEDKSTSGPVPRGAILKKDNSDTKSVASRTTLTLDEKESLRPDDSASMQAAIEEDVPSPSESVVANSGSKQNSDPDAQAFRDQLREIGLTGDQRVIMPRAQRPERIITGAPPNSGVAFQMPRQAAANTQPPSQPEAIRPRVTDPQMWIIPPDEKLLEALASPKDRLFVLKVEQDLIDFIKDPKEPFLQLPGTNSFYRMLSHKLADYYMLGHVVDDTMSSVRIFRTSNCRLPPPLIGSTPRTNGSTPPPSGPARKIMRRNGEPQTPDKASQAGDPPVDSLASSKAPSDVGSGGDNAKNDGGDDNDKSKLTREQRENRYNEARARIFKDFQASEEKEKEKEGTNGTNDKQLSRSSSTSGAKRNRRQKKPKDDGFEARSAFDPYGRRISEQVFGGQSQPETPTFGGYYVDGNGHIMQGATGGQANQDFNMTNFASPGGFTQAPNTSMQQTPYSMTSPTFSQDGYGVMNGSYDHNQFSATMGQDRTPKGTAPQLSNYGQEYMQQGWPPAGYMDPYGMGSMQYPDYNAGYAAYYNGQMMQPMSPGGFSGFSPQQNPQNFNQAYFSNVHNNQHFNPQSQTFVPTFTGGNGQHYNGSQYMPNQAGYTMHGYASSGGSAVNVPQTHSARSKNSKQENPISKWPTPSNLPAKPPQPAAFSPTTQRPGQQETKQPLPPKPIPTR